MSPFSFSSRPRNWNEIFELMAQSALGYRKLEEFHDLYKGGSLEILPFPQDLKERLLTHPHQKHVLGAVFVTDGDLGRIYIDPSAELGIVTPFLFHEIIHSLDDSLWRIAKNPGSDFQKREVIFQSECKAYSAQNTFQEELKKIYPDLRQFHESQYSDLPFLNRALDPSEVAMSLSQSSKT